MWRADFPIRPEVGVKGEEAVVEDISQLVSHSGNPTETLTSIVNLIQQRFATDVCSVYVLEQDRANLVLAATVGLRPESVGQVRMRVTEGLAGLVAEQAKPVVVPDASAHPRFKYFRDIGEDAFRTFLGVPVMDRGVLQGVLVVQTTEARVFTEEDVRMLATRACSWRPSSARLGRKGSSWRRSIAGWRRWRGISGGAGTRRASRCFAISIRCSGNGAITIRSRCSSRSTCTSSRCARPSSPSTGVSITPIGACRSTALQAHLGALATPACSGARPVAYFSAEFGLHESMPIYSGGLGILAGDHLKSASDLGIPLVGIGLFYDQGYFRQRLDANLWQHEEYIDTDHRLLPMEPAMAGGAPVTVDIETRTGRIWARVWRTAVGRNTLLLLDSNVEGNSPEDRELTARLYGGDQRVRIRQELLLGIGGVKALAALGISPGVVHLNEGHSAFASLELVRRRMEIEGINFDEAMRRVSSQVVFTTHTPVPAGHDRFGAELIEEHLGPVRDALGMSHDALLALGRVNAARLARRVLHDRARAQVESSCQRRVVAAWSRVTCDVDRALSGRA